MKSIDADLLGRLPLTDIAKVTFYKRDEIATVPGGARSYAGRVTKSRTYEYARLWVPLYDDVALAVRELAGP